MEMEKKMMGCRIPAFGVWNYCHDLPPITQCFDSAMQASRLMKRWNVHDRDRDGGREKKGVVAGEQLALFRGFPLQRKPTQIKVIRREAGKQHCNGGEEEAAEFGACCVCSEKQVGGRGGGGCKVVRMSAAAVDEDLYKVPQPLLYHQKPKKMRKVVWSMWMGCLGLDCIV